MTRDGYDGEFMFRFVERQNEPRDSQRSRVYAAENVAFRHAAFRANIVRWKYLADCRPFVEHVLTDEWARQRFRHITSITLNDGRGRRSACGYGDSHGRAVVWLPRIFRANHIIIHECAHVLMNATDDKLAAHGREFARAYLDLIAHHLGRTAAQIVRIQFDEHNVRYRRTHTFTHHTEVSSA